MSLAPRRDARPKPKSLSKEIKYAARQAILTGVRTILPGLVEAYDPKTKRATIQPIVKQAFIDGTTSARAPLIDVPVIQPSTGGYLVHFPIVEGDIVAIAFTQTGLATFKRAWGTGDLVEPVPASAFSDAIAFPWGMHNIEPVSNEGIVLQSASGNAYINLKDDEIRLKVGAGNVRLTDRNFDAWRG